MPDIMHLVALQASPERVYQALTTSEGIRGWWTRDADLETQIGGTGEFRFYGGDSVIRVRVAELEPPTRVVWHTISAFRPEWADTILSFDLRQDSDTTVLAFAHRGFAHADDVYALTTTGWGIYFGSLQNYLSTGEGTPR